MVNHNNSHLKVIDNIYLAERLGAIGLKIQTCKKIQSIMELIGEIGTNHNGKFDTAIKLIDMANEANIDTIKIQIYEPNDIVSPLVKSNLYKHNVEYEYWQDYINQRLITPKEWLPDLVNYCKDKSIGCLATVHSIDGAEFCLKNGIDRLKIASMDCTHYPFLEALADLDAPLLLSTGMATKEEIVKAVDVIKRNGSDLTLFHCVASYPPEYSEMNINFIKFLKKLQIDRVGLSDHSTDNLALLMAISLGIEVVEKHLTLDNDQEGPDHAFALDKQGCISWREAVDNGISAMGSVHKPMSKNELRNRKLYQRAAILNCTKAVGMKLSKEDIFFARPESTSGFLIKPDFVEPFIGMRFNQKVKKGQVLKAEFFK